MKWLPLLILGLTSAEAQKAGCDATAGCLPGAKEVPRLEITQSGVYENYLIDSRWEGGNRVKITAAEVTLRHCEIRNATGNGIGIFGDHVTIESCKIHHLLNSTFKDQHDAHGITGHWGHAIIRNCEIYYTSGDSVQFDPERNSQGEVLIENCTFWTGPLPADAAGFHAGETPGENAVDTKVIPGEANRCRLTIRNCYFHGWRQPGQIDNLAALNLKEHIDASISGCVLANNQVSFRLRGPGARGGAKVTIDNCAIFDSDVGLRIEDKIQDLHIKGLRFGADVREKHQYAAGGAGPGFVNEGEGTAASMDELLVRPSP